MRTSYYLVVMTLLTCGNELVSCGSDFDNLWEHVSEFFCGNNFLTCGNELVSCGNDFLTCGNELISSSNDLSTCGNNLLSCGDDLLTCGNYFLTCGNDLLSCGNETKNERKTVLCPFQASVHSARPPLQKHTCTYINILLPPPPRQVIFPPLQKKTPATYTHTANF